MTSEFDPVRLSCKLNKSENQGGDHKTDQKPHILHSTTIQEKIAIKKLKLKRKTLIMFITLPFFLL